MMVYASIVFLALSVEEFERFFDPIKRQADNVQKAWKYFSQCPRIVVSILFFFHKNVILLDCGVIVIDNLGFFG